MNTRKCVAAVVAGREFEAHLVLEPDAAGMLDAVKDLAMDTRRRFPGPNPVSLERADFGTLKSGEYVACEKTDGCRFALVCVTHRNAAGTFNVAALVDRKLAVFLLPLRNIPTALFQGTVVDGELAWDRVAGSFVYVAFDAVAVSGIPVGHAGLHDRLRALRAGMWAYKPDPHDPAIVEVKTFLSPAAPELRDHLASAARRFDVDGVVFTPVRDPVHFGRAMRLFKLKTKHTVDFVVRRGGLYAYDGRGGHVKVGRLAVAPPPDGSPPDGSPPDGSVVECTHAGGDLWFAETVREDKTTANDLLTFDKTMQNMREDLRLDEVLSVFHDTTGPAGL